MPEQQPRPRQDLRRDGEAVARTNDDAGGNPLGVGLVLSALTIFILMVVAEALAR